MKPVVTSEEMYYALREEHLQLVLDEYDEFSKKYINIKKKDKDFYFFYFMIDLEQGACIIKRVVGCGAESDLIRHIN